MWKRILGRLMVVEEVLPVDPVAVANERLNAVSSRVDDVLERSKS